MPNYRHYSLILHKSQKMGDNRIKHSVGKCILLIQKKLNEIAGRDQKNELKDKTLELGTQIKQVINYYRNIMIFLVISNKLVVTKKIKT